MFKALLKTLPSLSGNMKLSCFVDDYKRHNKVYSCSIKTAKLLPIAHSLFDKNIYVNLKNNSYEYDVKHFYKNYFDVFYKSYYSYSKMNIPIIDFTNTISDCNEDFQFGCKRISYTKYDNQLAFFAPIYIESVDDIKNKYFKITCTFNKVNKLRKELIIDIYDNIADEQSSNPWTHNGENYISDYLIRYAEKIDNLNMQILFMDDTNDKHLLIYDFRELGNEYLLYNGGNYIRCAECGRLVKNNKYSNRKYCSTCAAYVPQDTKQVTCVDCGRVFMVDAMNNRACRCADCQKEKQKEYQRISMAKLRERKDVK